MARILKTIAAIFLPFTVLSGCDTSEGLGKDPENAGDKFERPAQ